MSDQSRHGEKEVLAVFKATRPPASAAAGGSSDPVWARFWSWSSRNSYCWLLFLHLHHQPDLFFASCEPEFPRFSSFVPLFGGEIAQNCRVAASQWLRDRVGAVNGSCFVPLGGSCLNREGRINPSTDVIFLLITVTLRFTV